MYKVSYIGFPLFSYKIKKPPGGEAFNQLILLFPNVFGWFINSAGGHINKKRYYPQNNIHGKKTNAHISFALVGMRLTGLLIRDRPAQDGSAP